MPWMSVKDEVSNVARAVSESAKSQRTDGLQQWINAISATPGAFIASWWLIWNLAKSGYLLIIFLPVWGRTLWSICGSVDGKSPGLKRRPVVLLEIKWVITSIHMWPLLPNSTWPQKNSSLWSDLLPQKHLFLLLVHAEKKPRHETRTNLII